jgi:beta-lactam-binding protein with PASTA domain
MVLRDRRLWLGLIVAVVLAFVSYKVVLGLNRSNPGHPVSDQSTLTVGPVASTTTGSSIPAGDVAVPPVLGERLSQAKVQLTAAGLANVKTEDATGQNRIVIDDNNWIVDGQSPAVGTVVDTHTQIVLKVRKPTDAHSPQPAPFGTIPDVVCANYQDAQDALRKSGFFLLTATDGTGQHRLVLLDRDWVVTAQSAPAGTRPSLTTHITLTVVKYGEPTNNPNCQS